MMLPGFPLGYVGQWMRDSFYGISSGVDLLPSLQDTVRAVEWVYVERCNVFCLSRVLARFARIAFA